jgi:hypothetical protein
MAIDFEQLTHIIGSELVPKLETNHGLRIFAKERAKFEGWLKVELCEVLSRYSVDALPEQNYVDIYWHGWSMELKTVNTNYVHEMARKKHRPITKNVEGVIKDINKLQKRSNGRAVLFVVFPLEHHKKEWKDHLSKIESHIGKLWYREFSFHGGVPGVLYLGKV